MNTLDALLTGIATDPHENTGWLVLADYLAEAGRYREETFLRLHRRLLGGETAVRSEVVNLLLDGVVPIVPSRTLVLPGGVELKGNLVPGVGFVGVTQVTQVQWKAVMGTEPSHFKGPNRPVETVSWVDCNEFCTKLNEFLGDGTIVRLPTEAEWELACRAGTTTLFWSGDTEADLKKIGWYFSNSHRQTQDVGLLCPNPWGLYDVHGNVWEWCENEYNPNPEGLLADSVPSGAVRGSTTPTAAAAPTGATSPPAVPATSSGSEFDGNPNPEGLLVHEDTAFGAVAVTTTPWPAGRRPATGTSRRSDSTTSDSEFDGNNTRVLRGGSWVGFARGCRAAHRSGGAPVYLNRLIGFRACW